MRRLLTDGPAARVLAVPGESPAHGCQEVTGQDHSPPVGRRLASIAWLVHQVPTVTVLVALAGLGWFGHHSDWRLPKFSALFSTTSAARDDWCEEHNRPESQCFLCRPDAEAKFAAVYTAKFGEQPPKPTE